MSCPHNEILLPANAPPEYADRRVQMPNITPHVCRHTYCSNIAKAGMNPKTLQYLMGHSDISVTLNNYTHLGLEDAADELKRIASIRCKGKNTRRSALRLGRAFFLTTPQTAGFMI